MLVADADEVAQAAAALGFPVVLKGLQPGVVHKTERGLVRLGIASAVDAAAQYEELHRAMSGRGKILVQTSSGTPQEARQMESWARPGGILYLDGAIMSYPAGIGTPECTILYSGPAELFDRVKPVLLAFGDGALWVGSEVGQAAALDLACISFSIGSILGFLQGHIICEAENLPAEGFLQSVKGLMPVVEGMVNDVAGRLQRKDYGCGTAGSS